MARKSRWADWHERLSIGYEIDADGCHIWQRAKNSRGYGVIYFDGKLHLAHRAAWLVAYGVMPPAGMVIDHICEKKACVNPEHLRALTNSQNILRAYRHLDPKTEPKRARNRIAKAKYRAKQKVGGQNPLV